MGNKIEFQDKTLNIRKLKVAVLSNMLEWVKYSRGDSSTSFENFMDEIGKWRKVNRLLQTHAALLSAANAGAGYSFCTKKMARGGIKEKISIWPFH